MLKSSLKTPDISQRKKVDVQGFQFPAVLPVPTVFVLWFGESDNLEALSPAWLMCCAQVDFPSPTSLPARGISVSQLSSGLICH